MGNEHHLLLLVDGSALVHRAFHALPPLTMPRTGETIGAVFGFAMMLIKAINELKPTHYAVAFDRKAPTFRHKIFEQYKAQRPAMPEELAGQFGRVREVVDAFGMPVFELDGYEADDILGALSRQAGAQGMETVIVTGDADMMQLVSPTVKVFYPRPGGTFSDGMIYDEEAVRQRYGVSPAQIADLKALKGDPSDNIPGVKGVGDKTALKLISQFTTVEQMLERLAEIEPAKLQEKIRESVELVKQSKHLATILMETPVTLDFDRCCQVTRYDRNQVAALFREFGFNTLVNKLPLSAGETLPTAVPVVEVRSSPASYQAVNTPEALTGLVNRLTRAETLALSVEGSSLNPVSAGLVGVAVSVTEGEAYYIPVVQASALTGGLPQEAVLDALKPVLESAAISKTVYNGKYDLILLKEQGVELRNLGFDVMLAAYLLGSKTLSLKDIVFNRFGAEIMPASGLVGSGAKQIPLFQVDIDQVTQYACTNVDMIGRLKGLLDHELWQQDLAELCNQVELPLVGVLAQMERCGVLLDTAILGEMSGRLGESLRVIEQQIFEEAGQEFNVNSPQQLAVILFEKMHIPGKKTRGKYSTDAAVLEEFTGYPIVRYILDYRQLMKLKSTYIDALPCLINSRTGRLHTSFNQMRTSTGRLSSSEPNLQNIPVRSELGREIRRAFVAPPGTILMAGDYSQIDLRALAHLSEDPSLLTAFREDKDIHAATAAQLFGVEMAAVTADMRRFAKTVNFGVIYGMSEFGLEQRSELSRAEAARFIEAYFRQYPGVQRYFERTLKEAREKGYVQTVLGHRRFVPELNAANRMVREAAERMAINMPVQGTSSDIIKVAMIDLQKEMNTRQMKSRMLLQVHDELIFEVPFDEVKEMTQLVKDKMSTSIRLAVPLKVDIKSGPNWGAME